MAIVLAGIIGLGIIGPVTIGSVHASAAAPPTTEDPAVLASNPFIPDNVDLSDCTNSLPRPNCGSDQRSGYHQYVTLIVLFLGTLFIGWRITRGVRARDRVKNAEPKTPAGKT
ncbi:MAG: hypothetical protein JWN99_308 [Ilumatobacteraceae bacterium]|nr:hypothetical protein [Ilumatobacteraceae bacterium]